MPPRSRTSRTQQAPSRRTTLAPTSSHRAVDGVSYWDDDLGAYVSKKSLEFEEGRMSAHGTSGAPSGITDASSLQRDTEPATTPANVEYDVDLQKIATVQVQRGCIHIYLDGGALHLELVYPFQDYREKDNIAFLVNWWKLV
ncbi:hypothetical protein QFC24_000017 [Naganishia onofrii]|uniref:Uncharacterized protein n=1 Tax=Naganishia onofrii TaxID=1851511 RepID=A0ACC2XUN5_9TREE|nr:hypothetical protein QFC24_000017 [Naganishia onofrii]